MHPTSTNIHPVAFCGTLLTNAATFVISLQNHIETILRVALLLISIALTWKQLRNKPRSPKAPGNRHMLNLAGGFLLLCLLVSGCAWADHTLLASDGTPKANITNAIANLQAANAITAPADPYSPLIAALLGLATSGIGWYAHTRAKNQQIDAQTAHIATLQSLRRSVPTVKQSTLP